MSIATPLPNIGLFHYVSLPGNRTIKSHEIVKKLLSTDNESFSKYSKKDLLNEVETIRKIINLRDSLLQKMTIRVPNFKITSLGNIVASDITDSFRYHIAPDDAKTSYFTINGEKCIPPAMDDRKSESKRMKEFFRWLLEKINPHLPPDATLTIKEQADLLFLSPPSFQKEVTYFQQAAQEHGNSVEIFKQFFEQNKHNFDPQFVQILETYPGIFQMVFKDAYAEEYANALCEFTVKMIIRERYRHIPSITILQMMSIGAYARADKIMKEELAAFFYLPDSKFKIGLSRGAATSYNLEIENKEELEFDITQSKNYDIYQIQGVERKILGRIKVDWSIEGSVERQVAHLQIKKIAFLSTTDYKTQQEILKLFEKSHKNAAK